MGKWITDMYDEAGLSLEVDKCCYSISVMHFSDSIIVWILLTVPSKILNAGFGREAVGVRTLVKRSFAQKINTKTKEEKDEDLINPFSFFFSIIL